METHKLDETPRSEVVKRIQNATLMLIIYLQHFRTENTSYVIVREFVLKESLKEQYLWRAIGIMTLDTSREQGRV